MTDPYRQRSYLGRHVRPSAPDAPTPTDVNISGADDGVQVAADIVGPVEGQTPDGTSVPLALHRVHSNGQLTVDELTHNLLDCLLVELRQMRLHLEVLTGEDFSDSERE